jgi:hypothetical protein
MISHFSGSRVGSPGAFKLWVDEWIQLVQPHHGLVGVDALVQALPVDRAGTPGCQIG